MTWKGIKSSALKSIQYRVALLSDDGKEFVDTQYAPYASNPVIGTTADGTASIKTSSLGEGCFRVYVRGLDKYGSVGTGKGDSFVVDGTAPKLTSASITPTTYTNKSQPVIKWSGATDKYLKQVQYSIDDGSYASMGTIESGSFTVPAGKITTSGKHTVKVRAIDKAGNVSVVKTLSYYFDNKKPTGKITIEDATGADLGKYKIVFTASDANSGLKSVVLKLSGTSLSSDKVLYSGKAGGQVVFNPSSYAEGTYTLTLTVSDNCGNDFSVKKTFSSVNLTNWTPKNLTAQDKINYKSCLKWDRESKELPDNVSYEIYRGTSAGFEPNASNLAASGVRTCYWCEPNVNYGKTYYYKVRAYYVKAGKNIYGSYSKVKSVKITK